MRKASGQLGGEPTLSLSCKAPLQSVLAMTAIDGVKVTASGSYDQQT